MKKYTISIPEPCTVPVNEMTPVEGGRFCSNCQQRVVDFTGMTDQQMINYFERYGMGCGRFHSSQLNREIPVRASRNTWVPAALLAGMLTIITPETGKAQQKQITGIVKDSTNGKPLPGIFVKLKGSKLSTFSKKDGLFSLTIPENETEKPLRLIVICIGYISKEILLKKENMESQVQVQMVPYSDREAEIIAGVVMVKKQNWWQQMKSKPFNKTS